MKKRAMKKYIPKNTFYCYKVKYVNGERITIPCKNWVKVKSKPEQLNGYCKYLKLGDWQSEGFSLLWDQCKECNVSKKIKKTKTVDHITIDNKKIKVIDFI